MTQPIDRLLNIMARLRDPDTGCPWDVEQSHQSLRPYVIEEAYEVADAIDTNDIDHLIGELGDLLLQVVFHAQIAKEAGEFNFNDVVTRTSDKMIARHPHVFSDAAPRTAEEQKADWEKIKSHERDQSGATSLLDGVARALPALTRAEKLQKRAAGVGFDWNDTTRILDKIIEESQELINAEGTQKIEEFGDLLFTVVNLGRHLGVDPEAALESTNMKFIQRFQHIEARIIDSGEDIQTVPLNRLEALWQDGKNSRQK